MNINHIFNYISILHEIKGTLQNGILMLK